jgi:hypothetical protein
MSKETMSEEAKPVEATPNAPAILSTIPAEELSRLTDDIVGALKSVYDPEIPVDIYELGLIYKVDIADDRAVAVDMTLTSPNCRVFGPGCRPGQGQGRVRPALGPEPHVRGCQGCVEPVVTPLNPLVEYAV